MNSESIAVFVAPTGSDATGDGTKAKPLGSVQKAIDAAVVHGKKVVIACAGTYGTPIALNAAQDSMNIYGGVDCAAWSYSGLSAVVAPSASGYALHVSALSTGVHIEDFEFDSADGAVVSVPGADGSSSIAAFIADSKNVIFRNVLFKAGRGADGAQGANTPNYSAVQAPSGNPPSSPMVGAGSQSACSCVDNVVNSVGGGGGNGDIVAPGNGTDGLPKINTSDGKGGLGGGTCASGLGGTGANGAPGAGGRGGGQTDNKLGALSSSSWTPTHAESGKMGAVAQGGGGGAGGKYVATPNGGGGSGGCGGCGGGAGSGGGAGGSSFALVSVSSSVTLDHCTLHAGGAGDGGKGGDGQPGQPGGDHGNGSGNGCPGGSGGNGGAGGGGGGGAGGSSVAIAYSASPPIEQNATVKSTAAKGGAGGSPGNGGSPNPTKGLDGLAVNIQAF